MRLTIDQRHDAGPFDIIGDVHGCIDELRELIGRLGGTVEGDVARPAAGRRLVFLGDLTDRGPDSVGVLRLVLNMAAVGEALALPGNHDDKLRRALLGRKVMPKAGLDGTLAQLEGEPGEFRWRVARFLDSLPSHYIFDGGRLVAAHGGMSEALQGLDTPRARAFALYGLPSGETDLDGLPIRIQWALEYRGRALVVFGHTPVAAPLRLNHTVNIDTGCVFGGSLTAYRYPEDETVSVAARRVYSNRKTPWRAGGGGV
jgi:protein phosphatase